MAIYTDHFFDGITKSHQSAERIVPLVRELTDPTSVLDVGCGTGAWLAQWIAEGVTDVTGVDGDYVRTEHLAIPADNFKAADLSQPLDLGRTFDLVSTVEVAEHIDGIHASTFVDSLTRHGDTILFSAAAPGQGGHHHVNEQWPSYWANLFRARGYQPHDVLRPRIWDDGRILYWYRQNVLIFATPEAAERHQLPATSTGPLDIAHPRMVHSLTKDSPIQALRKQARRSISTSAVGRPLRVLRDVVERGR